MESGVLENKKVLDELRRLREAGLAIGLSVSGTGQPETILRALEVGGFDTVQATFNMLEVSAGPALTAAHEAGLGVIVKEGVANGRLTSRGNIAALQHEAERLQTTQDAVALAWLLEHEWIDVVLSGASAVGMLHENLVATELVGKLDRERLDSLTQEPSQYWDERSALPWN